MLRMIDRTVRPTYNRDKSTTHVAGFRLHSASIGDRAYFDLLDASRIL